MEISFELIRLILSKTTYYIKEDSINIRETILNIIKDNIENNIYSSSDIQVLSPMYDGLGGINSLNYIIRDYLNPKSVEKKEIKIGTTIYRIGDKILQLKNQPDDNVFNGDIGKIIAIYKGNDNKKNVSGAARQSYKSHAHASGRRGGV